MYRYLLNTLSVAALLFHSLYAGDAAIEKPLVVIIPSYNNADWLETNLFSIAMQKYSNYRVIYIDDASKDDTCQGVENWLIENQSDYQLINFDGSFSDDIPEVTAKFGELVNHEKHRYTIVKNTQRCGALCNLYRAIQSCHDDEIIVTVDGDDWLYLDTVLSDLNRVYSTQDIWLTHGSLIEYPLWLIIWSEAIPTDIIAKNAFREFKCPSHLRTFYTWLFKKIRLEDLLYEGKFFVMTWDMAIMYPMIEMAGSRHAFISDINYVYNNGNQLNDNKVDAECQRQLDRYIRAMPPYEKLK